MTVLKFRQIPNVSPEMVYFVSHVMCFIVVVVCPIMIFADNGQMSEADERPALADDVIQEIERRDVRK